MWPTRGRIGFRTPAVLGITNASERGTKSSLSHSWAYWLRHPSRLAGPQLFDAGDTASSGPQTGGLPMSPLPSGGGVVILCGHDIKKTTFENFDF